MSRVVRAIECIGEDQVLALDDSGLIWFGKLEQIIHKDKENERAIRWEPILGPPEGVHITEAKRSFWDRMETKLREAAKDQTDSE